jgi:TRAP-type C4-dicarboxylate transport system substrate-binding protein
MATFLVKPTLRGTLLAISALCLLLISANPASAQRGRTVIRMGSLAPQNSPWHESLMIMAERWREESNGQVRLQVIPNATAGEEADVLQKMSFGQLHAGTFSLAGLQNLTDAVAVLAIPMLAEDQEDLHRIRDAVGPYLEEVFLEQGYVLLHWADLGWMRFFTKDPNPDPDVVKGYRYVQWGDDSMSDLWREAGFPPGVRMNMADITIGLERGTVDAINTAPLVVAGYMWFSALKYMIDVRWAPLSGATLVDRDTWESIPEDLRVRLKGIAEEVGEEVQAKLLEWEAEAIDAMMGQGLEIIEPPPDIMEKWRVLFEQARGMLRGRVIPEAWFDEAIRVGTQGKGR